MTASASTSTSALAPATGSATSTSTTTGVAGSVPAESARSVAYRVRAVARPVAARLRAAATSVWTVGAPPGYPCRQCRRDADAGDEVVLVSYDPFAERNAAAASSRDRSASPIFLHRHDCSHRVDPGDVPAELERRTLSVRAVDDTATMVDAMVVEGAHSAVTLEGRFGDRDIERMHVHNAAPGRFGAVVTRG